MKKILIIILFGYLVFFHFFDSYIFRKLKIPEIEYVEENKEIIVLNNIKQVSTILYVGKIYINSLNIENNIIDNVLEKNLNKNLVGIFSHNTLDTLKGNIILAGHNNNQVFGRLKDIKLFDIIKIESLNNTYLYRVVNKVIINDDDFSYFTHNKDKKILTLITCYGKTKRFIVIGELVN